MRNLTLFAVATLAGVCALGSVAVADSITTSVPGLDGLGNPLATGFFMPASVSYTATTGGTVDLLAGGNYTGCNGMPYGCSYVTDPDGTIVYNNSQGVAFPGNPGDSNTIIGSAITDYPYGALIAEFVPTGAGSPTTEKLGRPLLRCTSTCTSGAAMPSWARLSVRSTEKPMP